MGATQTTINFGKLLVSTANFGRAMKIAGYSGIVPNIINSNSQIAGCSDLLIAGKWLWPGDLPYYVQKYHLQLDKIFIKTMKDYNWYVDNSLKINYENLELV